MSWTLHEDVLISEFGCVCVSHKRAARFSCMLDVQDELVVWRPDFGFTQKSDQVSCKLDIEGEL